METISPAKKVQEAYRIPNRLDKNMKSSQPIINKILNVQYKKILNFVRGNGRITFKARPIRFIPEFQQRL